MGPDRISVCICTYRRPELLRRLLDSLTVQKADPSFTFDVVVIDNDRERSAESTVAAFKASGALKVTYGCEPEQNISLTRNRAVRTASGTLVAFIDDDERPSAEWLSQLYRTLRQFDADGALGPVVPDYPDGMPSWVRKGGFCERRRLSTGTFITAADARTGNVLLSRSLFPHGAMWFDPALGKTGGEDSDFFSRQLNDGRKFVWCDEAPAFEAVPPERWKASYYIKRYLRSGAQDGEWMRSGKLPAGNGLARNAVILTACTIVGPFTLLLPKHLRVQVLRKMAYCAGVVTGYLGFSLLRARDEQNHYGGAQSPAYTDEFAASVAKRSAHFAISAVYFVARGIYRFALRLTGRRVERRPVVLMYHAIQACEVPRFENQLRQVRDAASPVPATNLLARRNGQEVAVTFDDGFTNVFDNAVPLLAKYQVPATCFIPTGYIGGQAGWMALRPPNGRPVNLEQLATANTLAAVDARWITIGSHTVSHPHLTALDGPALEGELVESKGTLERITQKSVTTLSFPYGSFSDKVVEAAAAAGYAQVFANVPVRTRRQGTTALVGRVSVSTQDWPLEFKLKVLGAYEWLAVAIPAKHALLRCLRWRAGS